MKTLFATVAAASTSLAQAHSGHGLPGTHWHASDTWGFVALGVAIALVLWARRGK
jgi:hypothetical protein